MMRYNPGMRRRRQRGQGMIEYALIVGLISIFVIVVMIEIYDFGAAKILGDVSGYEAKSKVQLRDSLLNTGVQLTTQQEEYLSGAFTTDPSDDLDIY